MQLKTFCPYQVGDIYLTTAANDPTALWPGTSWQALQDCVLMAAGNIYAAGSTGGSATHSHTTGDCTLTSNQIPSHSHSVGAHAHGLNSHTHTYAKPHTPTGGTALTEAQLAKPGHFLSGAPRTSGSGGTTSGTGVPPHNNQLSGVQFQPPTEQVGSGSTHTHTIGTTSTNTGGPSTTNTANSAAFDSGTAGGGGAHNHGNTGSGSSLPPYLAVYMWKRVA